MEAIICAIIKIKAIIIAKSHIPIASTTDRIPKNISTKIISTLITTMTIKPIIPAIILFHLYCVSVLLFFFYINAKSAFAQYACR